jgi:uncharacterized membrane protein YfcA
MPAQAHGQIFLISAVVCTKGFMPPEVSRTVDFLVVLIALLAGAFAAGIAGSFLGIGGGVFLIPFMTLVLGVDIKVAIATSLIGVIATSSGAASVYVRDHLSNLRLGMFLEVATSAGAITGAFVAIFLDRNILYVVFGLTVLFAASRMTGRDTPPAAARNGSSGSRWVTRLGLSGSYRDREGESHAYAVARPGPGFGISAVAGALSGLLGVGGGFIKVPAMNVVMGVPMKPAVATSNFMIGVTAAASAFIYYARGLIDPSLAAMLVLGVFTGTRIGTRLMVKAQPHRLRLIFALFLGGLGVFMLLRPLLSGVNF